MIKILDRYLTIIGNKMETFTNIYSKNIVDFLTFYETDKKQIDETSIIRTIELEFNEERGITIEIHASKNNVLDIHNIFYMIVCDARCSYCSMDIENYAHVQDYMECNLGAKKLCFLIGDDNYNKLMTCEMDFTA